MRKTQGTEDVFELPQRWGRSELIPRGGRFRMRPISVQKLDLAGVEVIDSADDDELAFALETFDQVTGNAAA